MAGINRTILKDSDPTWNRVPFQVSFGATFTSMADAMSYISREYEDMATNGDLNETPMSAEELTEYIGAPQNMNKPYFKDTRLGANDAINCIWQFNRDDDIVHPMMMSDSRGIGMGRVYAATTEQNQSLMWLTFGVPKFNPLVDYYTNAIEADLVQLHNTGFSSKSLGAIFGSLGAFAFAIPMLPFKWLKSLTDYFTDYPVSRFYELRTTMHLYYKHVDSIMAEWLVNAGIYGQGSDAEDGLTSKKTLADPGSLPLSIRETGVSIWDILGRKAKLLGMANDMNFDDYVDEIITSEDAYDKPDNPFNDNGIDWASLVEESALGSSQFIGFRIEKSTDASESFSNSTGTSAFAEKINNMAREKSSAKFDKGSNAGGWNTGIEILDSSTKAINDFFSGAAESVNLDGMHAAIYSGAYIDVPEHYTGSDFNKSHSVSFQLRAPYGDIVSIYQSIIVPLSCILAGALPRAAGPNSWASPFLCRMYIKGIASVPLGIIDSVSIKRGSSEHGWTYQNLPTCVDVTISIKDLSPMMYMSIKSDTFKSLLGANNSFNEYLLTLAGIGLFERVSQYKQLKRRIQLAAHKVRNQTLNPNAWASSVGYNSIVRTVVSFMDGWTPRNISNR